MDWVEVQILNLQGVGRVAVGRSSLGQQWVNVIYNSSSEGSAMLGGAGSIFNCQIPAMLEGERGLAAGWGARCVYL